MDKPDFSFDKDTKDMLTAISNIYGVKEDVIKEVWEYTLFYWFLQINSQNKKVKTIQVPFLGNIGVKYKNDSINEEGIFADADIFVSLSDSFKKMLSDIYNGNKSSLIEFFDKNVIDKLE